MPSSKKQRGRQRKAAAKKGWREAAVAGESIPMSPKSMREFNNDILNDVRRGDRYATMSVLELFEQDNDCVNLEENRRYFIKAGLVEVVLGLLKRCENSEFWDVVKDSAAPLADPSGWLAILVKVSTDVWSDDMVISIRMQIVRAFGPVVKCMCRTPGKFFHSEDYWFTSVHLFICLVETLVQTRETIPILLAHKGLIEFMVQLIFWGSHRPDLVESGRLHLQLVASTGRDFLGHLMKVNECKTNTDATFDVHAHSCLKAIGSTPIAGKNSDMFVLRLIAHLHVCQKTNATKNDRFFSFRGVLQVLLKAGCVDRSVISGVISLARHDKLDYEDSHYVTSMMLNMFVPTQSWNSIGGKMVNYDGTPYDNLFAFAVDQSLIETCLGLLVRFKDDGEGKVLERLLELSQFALNISMSMKSYKAFIRQRSQITKAIQDTEAKLEGCNIQCQDVIRRIKMIMHLNGGIAHYAAKKCCRCCSKIIPEDDLMQCSACMLATYCSRSCQEEDWGCGNWPFGHQHSCKDRRTAALETNIHVVVNKLMAENHNSLLAQAFLRGVDILHCIVIIDVTRPSIRLTPFEGLLKLMPSEYFDSFRNMIHRNQSAGFVMSMCNFYSCQRH